MWGTPWSKPTLYFHGDSPISLGDFCGSYFVHGGGRYDAARTSTASAGEGYAYSNLAVALAGFVAEAVSGVDFDDLCKQRILQPLGMTDTGYRLADIGTTNLAMPYTTSNRDLSPSSYTATRTIRTAHFERARSPGEMARSLHELRVFQGARVLDEATVARDPAEPDPRDGPMAPRPDLVRAEAPWGFLAMGHTGGDFGESTRMFFRPDRA